MLRKFASVAVALVLVFAVASVADAQGKGKKGKATTGKITKVEGDKLTVAVKGKNKGETEEKTFTLTTDTKFMDGKTEITDAAKVSEFKKGLKEGTAVRFQADKDGNVKSISKVTAKKKNK
jgi:hypothetical protein